MSPKMLFRTAMALLVLSPLVLVVLTLTGDLTVPALVPLIAVTTFSLGIVMPNSTHGALQPMGRTAGVASAVLRAIQMACGAAASGLVAAWYDGESAIAMTGTMLLCAGAAAIVYLWMLKPALAKATPA
jgi:DHA1 family bicyclomycin/chloramphenicol resistance-like MFS transporter